MRPERKQNHLLIKFLSDLGHRVRIKHNRQWNPVIVQDERDGLFIVYRIKNTGGICRVTIETADGDIHEGLFTNHSKLQYNKNFAVHVALQRAIQSMNASNEAGLNAEQIVNAAIARGESIVDDDGYDGIDMPGEVWKERVEEFKSRQLQDNL